MRTTMHSFDTNASNVPAFLVKLWKLVEDDSCNDMIAWSDSGASFIIRDQAKFAKELLPQYFKHNNMASFIRQLNMYGFRKVMNYEKSGLKSENDEMEFHHAFFCKGQGELLELIKRKIPNTKVSEPAVKSNPKDILTDLTSIREKQENMDNMLLKMKKENELLWRELTSMRQKHKAQEQIIQKVIQFLVSIVQRSNQNIGVQRKMACMLQDSPGSKGKNSRVTRTLDVVRKNNSDCFITVPQEKMVSPLGPVIHEVTDLDHDLEEIQCSSLSPAVKSPDDLTKMDTIIECPLNSSLNSPINTSVTMEPLSILEPLQPRTPALSDDSNPGESVLGIPLEYITIPVEESPINVISIPDDGSCDAASSVIPVASADTTTSITSENVLDPGTFTLNPQNMLVYSPLEKHDFDDATMSESLLTPTIPTIHIEDIPCLEAVGSKTNDEISKQSTPNEYAKKNSKQNEHNYQIALPESSLVKPSNITKNTLTNHLLNVEEELNWLKDNIASNSWNIDATKLLTLFSADDVANNESLAGQIAAESNIKEDQHDIVGNELVQFTPSMLEVELDIENAPFYDCLNQDAEIQTGITIDQKDNLITDVLSDSADQIAASEAAEFLLNNGNILKHNSSRRSKAPKTPRSKRRKLK